MGKQRSKMTPIQVQMLVDILFENSEIASGSISSRFTRDERNKKWEAVATLLNSKGLGPQKTAEQWRKSWADLKCAIRSKATKIELAGGTGLMNDKLSNLEKRVLQLAGDIRIETPEGNENKVTMKQLEADLAKTEEDLMKALKKPNQIVLPYSVSKIFQVPTDTQMKMPPIVENVEVKEITNKQDKIYIETNDDDDDEEEEEIEITNDTYTEANNDSSDEIILYDDNSDINEDASDDPDKKPAIPPAKKRKLSSLDVSGTSSEPKSFISIFQRQIETQTVVLKEQTSIMRDIAKSLKLIANSLHGT